MFNVSRLCCCTPPLHAGINNAEVNQGNLAIVGQAGTVGECVGPAIALMPQCLLAWCVQAVSCVKASTARHGLPHDVTRNPGDFGVWGATCVHCQAG